MAMENRWTSPVFKLSMIYGIFIKFHGLPTEASWIFPQRSPSSMNEPRLVQVSSPPVPTGAYADGLGGEYWGSSSKVMEPWGNIPKGWKINIILKGKMSRNETHHFLKIWDDSCSSISDSHKIVSQFLRHMHIWLFNSIIVISHESNDNNICCRYSPQTICYLHR